jgi:hypothetical protein
MTFSLAAISNDGKILTFYSNGEGSLFKPKKRD